MQSCNVDANKLIIVFGIFKMLKEWSDFNCLLQVHVDIAMHVRFIMNHTICVALVERCHFHMLVLHKSRFKYFQTLYQREDILGSILEVTTVYLHLLHLMFMLIKAFLELNVVYILFGLKGQRITTQEDFIQMILAKFLATIYL